MATPVRYDVLIFGGGSAGCVLAARLSEDAIKNLYVCDASVFATIPRANTHLPTLALAERAAELLRHPS